MADEYEGTPSLEAPEDTSGSEPQDSPDLEYDTQEDSGSESERGTEDVSVLRKEMEDLKKRVSGQTRAWQQEHAKATEYEKRLEKWKRAGVNLDDIDKAVDTHLSQFQGQQGQTAHGQSSVPGPGVVTRDELQTVLANQRYVQTCEGIADKYFLKNPDDDNPLFRRQISDSAIRLANQEVQMHGSVVSSPEELMRASFKELNELKSIVTKKVQKSATETREKIKGQGVTDTQHRKQRPAEGDEEREMSPEDYVAMFRNHQQRVRSKR